VTRPQAPFTIFVVPHQAPFARFDGCRLEHKIILDSPHKTFIRIFYLKHVAKIWDAARGYDLRCRTWLRFTMPHVATIYDAARGYEYCTSPKCSYGHTVHNKFSYPRFPLVTCVFSLPKQTLNCQYHFVIITCVLTKHINPLCRSCQKHEICYHLWK
jgi:hypothetical protein